MAELSDVLLFPKDLRVEPPELFTVKVLRPVEAEPENRKTALY